MKQLLYYDNQESWGSSDWYALYRYLDRMLSSKREHRSEEILDLDLSRMSAETKYLLYHLIVLQRLNLSSVNGLPGLGGEVDRDLMRREMGLFFRKFQNLRPLLHEARDRTLVLPNPPLILSDPPRHSWPYFRQQQIWL